MPNVVPQVVAGGDIYPARFVKLSSSADHTVLQGTDNSELIGISQSGSNKAPLSDLVSTAKAAEAGQNLQIFTEGDVCLLEAGATITRGNLLKSDANGKGVPIATSGTTIQNYGAVALENGANGELIKVQVRFGKVRPALA